MEQAKPQQCCVAAPESFQAPHTPPSSYTLHLLECIHSHDHRDTEHAGIFNLFPQIAEALFNQLQVL